MQYHKSNVYELRKANDDGLYYVVTLQSIEQAKKVLQKAISSYPNEEFVLVRITTKTKTTEKIINV